MQSAMRKSKSRHEYRVVEMSTTFLKLQSYLLIVSRRSKYMNATKIAVMKGI